MCKFVITEMANKVTYDSLQIHGGTGYMRDFNIERLARDARITNIYEGTTQLQVVATYGGVKNDVMKDYFDEAGNKDYKELDHLNELLKKIRTIYYEVRDFIINKKDDNFTDTAAKQLLEIYSSCTLDI